MKSVESLDAIYEVNLGHIAVDRLVVYLAALLSVPR